MIQKVTARVTLAVCIGRYIYNMQLTTSKSRQLWRFVFIATCCVVRAVRRAETGQRNTSLIWTQLASDLSNSRSDRPRSIILHPRN